MDRNDRIRSRRPLPVFWPLAAWAALAVGAEPPDPNSPKPESATDVAASESHDHAHHHQGMADADVTRRHAPDAPLRTGMRAIRARVDGGTTGTVLAEGIRSDVQAMFRQCTLPPEADATLHRILARILDLTTAVESSTQHAGADPKADLRAALDDYACRFDDPEFAACAKP